MNISFERRHSAGMVLRPMGGGGGGGSSPAQNYATLAQVAMSQEQLNWAKAIYQEQAPDRARTQDLSNQVAEAQLAQMSQQTNIAAQAQEDYNSTYRPLEQQLVADATTYDTPERRAAESAAAVASVEKNLAQQRGATTREMERSGVDPSSGKMAAMQGSMDLNAAKLKAGAGNAASKAIETIGYGRRMDAASLGRNIASSQGTNAALASQLGSSAVGSSGAGLNAAMAGSQFMQNAYNSSISGMRGATSGLGAGGGGKDNSALIGGGLAGVGAGVAAYAGGATAATALGTAAVVF